MSVNLNMTTPVSEMTAQDLKALIAETMAESLREMFADPDEGMTLRPEIGERLRQAHSRFLRGEQGVPLTEVAKRFKVEL